MQCLSYSPRQSRFVRTQELKRLGLLDRLGRPCVLKSDSDGVAIAHFVEAFRSRNVGISGWHSGAASVWRPAGTRDNSIGPGDGRAENSVRTVRASTNEDQIARNSLEKNWTGKQTLGGPMRAVNSPRSSLTAKPIALR